MANLVESRKTIVKVDLVCGDAHWRNKVDKAILRNVDASRRKRKSLGTPMPAPVPERTVKKIMLSKAPDTPVWDVFTEDTEDDKKLEVARLCLSTNKKLPTKEQLQAFARGRGKPLSYAHVAPVHKGFCSKLMGAVAGLEVTLVDDASVQYTGTLQEWSEKNDRWLLKVCLDGGARCNFSSAGAPALEVSDTLADWLQPEASSS
mmetsp:Transcript_79379/g.179108  ORF Transcript_79379/g.179108 Transcript_79379/m.179108 type:complete len:204 (+) Transcript_79379:1-612(+)